MNLVGVYETYKMNIFSAILFCCVCLSVRESRGQVIQFGLCPEVATVKYFDLERFLGQWYEILRFPTWYEEYGQCAYKRIMSCGRHIEIEHVFVKDQIEFVLHVNSTYSPGDAAIFVIAQNSIDPIGIPISVIATNYDDYAVIYGCTHSEEQNIKYVSAWVLSRSRTLSNEDTQTTFDTINAIPTLSSAYLETVLQDEAKCSHYWTAHVQAENTTIDLPMVKSTDHKWSVVKRDLFKARQV